MAIINESREHDLWFTLSEVYHQNKSCKDVTASPSCDPDGEVGQQAFVVVREAIRKEGMVAIGKVVFTSREHIIGLEARGKRMVGVMLRYPYEVRDESEYFDDIEDEKVPKDMLDLANDECKVVLSEARSADYKSRCSCK